MDDLMFIQMSGAPGSGKTTLAQAIGQRTGAVVIDHDVTKSALLAANVPIARAGRASYIVLDALARHLLLQGHSVIFDSPCFYHELLERGQRLAHEVHASYRYVECVVTDIAELDRRLRTRPHWPSQLTGISQTPSIGLGEAQSSEATFRDWIDNMKRPTTGYIAVDTTRPVEECVQITIQYLTTGIGNQ